MVAALALVASGCGDDSDEPGDAGSQERSTSGGELIGPANEGIEGVEAFEVADTTHTADNLAYDHDPPVGGEHFAVPATCGFYDTDPPTDEMLVHSLEHGAIWVAYASDLDEAGTSALSGLATSQAKVVITPREGLDAPVVVSAWARQLALDSADDPRLVQFIEQYRGSPNAPEPPAPCSGAGEPAVVSSPQ